MFVRNFQMTLAATGTLDMKAKVHYICTLVRGEFLLQFDLLSADVENTDTTLTVEYLIKGLACFFLSIRLKKSM